MITQTLDRGIQISDDNRGSGRLDLLLYGSPDPNKNRATRRARTLAPDEMRSKGYQDGFYNRGMLGSACTNPNYLQGYNEGCNARPSAA